ncbi:hypothetical protein AAG906_010270 [Vitis piasezkii]|uniref:Pectinesterase n=2 Tax=Vitis vinifera TaxID=29760 RepID=A5BC09_VITVI|eukprot:XP_002264297.1 PREDICTED: pectinesterase QRT1 [Vitis vinifera]
MGFSGFSASLCVVGLILVLSGGGCEGKANDNLRFITWSDFTARRARPLLTVKCRNNTTKVIVVDKNGGGDSDTIQGAVDMVPVQNKQRVKIQIRPGIYREKVYVPASKPYISFIGSQIRSDDVVITWHDKASDLDSNGFRLGTVRTASVTVESDYFCAAGITIENSVVARPGVPGMQAVALNINGDKAMFYNVRLLGAQDTLMDLSGTHYFNQCYIQGSIDFIFGGARSIYQGCVIESIATTSGAIAAHRMESPDDGTGFSFVNCTIIGTGKIYLGRAWGKYSTAVYSNSRIADMITPSGWSDWNKPERRRTAMFAEFNNTGKGADRSRRVKWSKSLSLEEAMPFVDLNFIAAEKWLRL